VQFSRYDSELRAHRKGAPKELSYNYYKPAVNRFSTTYCCFSTSLFQPCFIFTYAPPMGINEKTIANIQTIQLILT